MLPNILPIFGSHNSIIPAQQNLRVCESCNATYCINGDESGYWLCFNIFNKPQEGLCEFCKPTGKYSLTNYKTSGIVN